jgi:hypothetical protein
LGPVDFRFDPAEEAPSTTAAARYRVWRGGVTVLLALAMLMVYDCCGGRGGAGDGSGFGAGGVV